MDNKNGRYIVIGIVAFIVGWAIGLFLFGWVIWPVEYSGAYPQDLTDKYQETYIVGFADLYAFDNNTERAKAAFEDWPEAPQTICQYAGTSSASDEVARLNALAGVLNESGCIDLDTSPVEDEAGGGRGGTGNIALICGLLALLAVVSLAIYLVWQRRRGQSDDQSSHVDEPSDVFTPEGELSEQQITPIARFQTSYVRGHDTYDESFSIENADGDFLGECGVGLSETIGADLPKNVTAFEVWLFDKNDIRTVTKVVMSDHAFFDEAIKAKLAPKGEPVLARPNETIVLETATLIVNAVITELEYGDESMPAQSYFERFVVELSAWAKEGDFPEPDIQGHVDDMLDF